MKLLIIIALLELVILSNQYILIKKHLNEIEKNKINK
jgi:hypothetical protein